jgi:hypothetical protein
MFYKITINSWKDVLSLFDKITNEVSDWAFRGQSDKSWKLSTKFERDATKYKCDDPYWFYNREHFILNDFQRRAHHYIENLPKSENTIEWLSLLQHYGGPTRLLDFTYSLYIALFFATETSETDSAIWAVNINRLFRHLSKSNDYKLLEHGDTYEIICEKNIKYAETVIYKRNKDNVVFLIDPFKQHERISVQQGLFLFPGNISKSFEFNLSSVFELGFDKLSDKNAIDINISKINRFNPLEILDISVIKIIIPFSLHSEVLVELYKMNITAASLFPGLDGFARSLSFRFRQLHYFLNRKKNSGSNK